MIHPSYVDLMQVVNKGVEEGETPVINSRYSIVMATAKRARQMIHILAENEPEEEEETLEAEAAEEMEADSAEGDEITE